MFVSKRLPSPKTLWGKQVWFWQRYRFKIQYFVFKWFVFHELAWKKCCLVFLWFVEGLILKMTTQLLLSNWFCPTCLAFCCCDFSDPGCQRNRVKWTLFLVEAFVSDWHLSVSWFNLTGTVWFVFPWTWITWTTMGVSPCVACFFLFLFVYLYFQRLC